jgi:hypothetical protein
MLRSYFWYIWACLWFQTFHRKMTIFFVSNFKICRSVVYRTFWLTLGESMFLNLTVDLTTKLYSYCFNNKWIIGYFLQCNYLSRCLVTNEINSGIWKEKNYSENKCLKKIRRKEKVNKNVLCFHTTYYWLLLKHTDNSSWVIKEIVC